MKKDLKLKHLIVHILINKKYLTFNNYKAKCAVGKRGIGFKKKEGDLITPKGRFRIKYILYRSDRIKKIQSKIKKIVIKKNMGWCDDPKSKNIINLLNYHLIIVMKNFIKKKIFTILY